MKYELFIDPCKDLTGQGEHSRMDLYLTEVMSKWKCKKFNSEN